MDSGMNDYGPEVWWNPREGVWIAEEWLSPGPYCVRGEGATIREAIDALERILAETEAAEAEAARLDEEHYNRVWADEGRPR